MSFLCYMRIFLLYIVSKYGANTLTLVYICDILFCYV